MIAVIILIIIVSTYIGITAVINRNDSLERYHLNMVQGRSKTNSNQTKKDRDIIMSSVDRNLWFTNFKCSKIFSKKNGLSVDGIAGPKT